MRSGSRPKRVLLPFILGIAVPSLLLGYLAFRGIQNDQALLEKNRTDGHRRTAGLVTRAVTDSIKITEEALLVALSGGPGETEPARASQLEKFSATHPLVEAVFLWQDPDIIRFPGAHLQFLPPGSTTGGQMESRSARSNDIALAGERLEFGQQDYSAALASYRQALDGATGPQARAQLTSAVARVQKKAGRVPDAIASYERIAREFDQVRSGGGIPLGLAARLELASLHAATGDSQRSLQAYADLYEFLERGTWALEEAQFDFCVQQVSAGANDVLRRAPLDPRLSSQANRLASLKEEQEKHRATARRLLSFSAVAARSIGSDVFSTPGLAPGSFRRLVVEAGGRPYLVSVQTGKAHTREVNETWGLLLDPDSLEDLLRQLLTTNASPDTTWTVRGADDKVLFASTRGPAGPLAIRARFPDNVPNWSVEIFQTDPPRLTTLLGDRQGIYLYMFLLIAGILVFGLILTARTVSHEMELARMKSDFVSTVSHEFKSPLTSVQQVAEMLQAGRVPSEDRRQQYYDLLVEQSQRLCLLTDNILDLARIEEGRKRFAFERLDVAVLLKDLVPVVQDRVRHEGFVISMEIEEPLPEIVADGDALAQALTNLLDNAVKYSGQARSIVVGARIEERHLVVSVKDFGIGIEKDQAGRVFDRFYRGGNELTRSVKGSGLGLTLVKEIVEAHHGTIRVDSEPGRGSTFSIRLPLR